jgi:hypothetical protein
MIHGESRFFKNWQMSKDVSNNLMKCDVEETNNLLNAWLDTTGIYNRFQFKLEPNEQPHHRSIVSTIQQYTQCNF